MAKISITDIQQIYEKVFRKKSPVLDIKPLSGGFKNEVYLVFDGKFHFVLKVDSKDLSKLVSIDQNIMWWEAKMLQLMNSQRIPSPEFLFFDASCEIISFPYVCMSYVPGYNYLSARSNMNQHDIDSIQYQLGCLANQISSNKRDFYFLPNQPGTIFKNNYDFVVYLFHKLFEDASRLNCLDSKIYLKVQSILHHYQKSLINVSSPSLTNTDMWYGNVLVSGDKVTGLIDFADMYYCDELMNFQFQPVDGDVSASFLKGYNNKHLNQQEKDRTDIYRAYIFMKMIINGTLMENKELDWIYDNFNAQINYLSREKRK